MQMKQAMPLTTAQVTEFHRDGYLILPAVFTPDEIALMAREADRMLELIINSALATGKLNSRCDLSVGSDGRIQFRKLQPVNDLSNTMRAASEDERLLGPLRQLMNGQQPILMEEKLNYKQTIHCPAYIELFQPKSGSDKFPLHHDWGYYRAQGYPEQTLSSAVTIDATTPENGPIRVIPGTHKQEFALKNPDPTSGDGEVMDGQFDPEDRVDVIAPAGSVMLFHSKLLHDSKANRSGRPRRLMIYSHYPGNYTFEEDQRNHCGREAGQQVEREYANKIKSGVYQNLFTL